MPPVPGGAERAGLARWRPPAGGAARHGGARQLEQLLAVIVAAATASGARWIDGVDGAGLGRDQVDELDLGAASGAATSAAATPGRG